MKELWLYLISLRGIMNIFEVMILNMAPIFSCQSQKRYYLGTSVMGKDYLLSLEFHMQPSLSRERSYILLIGTTLEW